MTRPTRVSALATSLLAVALASTVSPPVHTQSSATTYTVMDIGTLGGATTARGADAFTFAIVGSATVSGRTLPFTRTLYDGIAPLPTLGGANGDANAVAGCTVGRSQLPSGRYHATWWNGAGPLDLGTLGGNESVAYAVNDDCVIVGSADTAEAGGSEAFRYEVYGAATLAPLGIRFGGNRSIAYGVNASGTIVGTATLAGNAVSHAFSWIGGAATDLGSPGGTSVALSVNATDDIVGYWRSTDGAATSAFLHRSGAMQTLPSLGGAVTRAIWINRDGVVVGDADTASGARHAVIWRDGAITDLNTLIPSGAGWVLQAADHIDDFGQIVGYGTYRGQRRGFVLLPPVDLTIRLDAVHDEDTNYPRPVAAGDGIPFGFQVLSARDPVSLSTGQVVVDRITGPIEYVSWDAHGAECTQSGQTLTCRALRAMDPGSDGIWAIIRTRTTGTGALTHTATVSADQADPDLSNNSGAQANVAISLADLSVASPIVGGNPALSRVTLTGPTSFGGSRVRLTSSNTAVASPPEFVDVQQWDYGGLSRDFYVATSAVSAVTDVQISATFGLVTKTVTLRVLPFAPTPWNGGARSVPGQIEAEDYDVGGEGIAYHDTTPGNAGGVYRTNRVDIAAATDAGGGYTVGWIVAGEWLNYSVDVGTEGDYEVQARVASRGAGGSFHLEAKNAQRSGPVAIPDTGGWQSWRTVTAPIHLVSGGQALRIAFDTNGASGSVGNLNWIRVARAGSTSSPYSGTPLALPGRIEAERFDLGGAAVAYNDTTTGNLGGDFRATQVDIQSTTDDGGGYLVGWTKAGEWLNYTVDVPVAGNYVLSARVASNGGGGTFHVEAAGVDVTGPIQVPSTGGWQTFTTLTRWVTLPAGPTVLRVVGDANGATGGVANMNWFAVSEP